MKKAIMYGGGNIGRGFIGMLFSQSGYEVNFIDVVDTVVNTLNAEHSYPVRILKGDSAEDVLVENVKATNGNNQEEVAAAIAECDIMATAVGVRILKFIVPNIVAGLRKRFAESERPLNIIICENLNNANKILEGMLKEQMTEEECKLFDERVGLVEASIGRMVPIQTPEMQGDHPLRVCVESYGFLPVDKEAFKGEIPEVKNMIPFAPFDYFLKRKLFLHNMGHACFAYLGGLKDYEFIWQAIEDADLYVIAENAMQSSAFALSAEYGVPVTDIFPHIQDLLVRMGNKALGDTCERVGREPERKLMPDDRLVGAYKLCEKHGIDNSFIAAGIGGALYRYINEQGKEQGEEAAKAVLAEIAGCEIPKAIDFYKMLLAKASFGEIRAKAEKLRRAGLGDVI